MSQIKTMVTVNFTCNDEPDPLSTKKCFRLYRALIYLNRTHDTFLIFAVFLKKEGQFVNRT